MANLIGRKIVGVRATTKQERDDSDWYGDGLILTLDDGTLLSVDQDEEGNGPGFMTYTAPKSDGKGSFGWIKPDGTLAQMGEYS